MKEITSLKQYKAKKHFFNLFIILMQILLFVIFLLIWEISARFKWIDPFLVSSPSAIFNLFPILNKIFYFLILKYLL